LSVLHNVKKNEALKKQSLVLRMDLQFSQRCIINCELSFWNKIENCPFLRKMQSINICLICAKVNEEKERKNEYMNKYWNISTSFNKKFICRTMGKNGEFFMLKISCFQACSTEALFLNLQRGVCSYFLYFYIKANIWKLTTFFYLQTWCCKD